jgi:DNA-binding protein H-NS
LATYVFFPPEHLAKAIEKEVINIEERVQSIQESKLQDGINAKVIIEDAVKLPGNHD